MKGMLKQILFIIMLAAIIVTATIPSASFRLPANGKRKKKIVVINKLRSAIALVILRLLMLLRRRIMIRKRLK